jgi:hypothetical protein
LKKPVAGHFAIREVRMNALLQSICGGKNTASHISPGKEIINGILGSLAATALMDILLIAILWAAGIRPFTCFSIIGDTVANVFLIRGMADSVPLGAATHYIIGPVLGAMFGLIQRYFPALRVASRRKSMLLSVFYAEIVSLPLLSLPPLFLHMTASVSLLWFGGSFGMHSIWGCIFGTVWQLMMPRSANQVLEPCPEGLFEIKSPVSK